MTYIDTYNNKAIVFVDREQSVLAIIHRLLRDLTSGYDLIPATSEATALSLLDKHSVSLMIINAHPSVDTISLIHSVKARDPNCQILVLSYADLPPNQNLELAGADFYLSMPFPFSHFGQVVQTALNRNMHMSYA